MCNRVFILSVAILGCSTLPPFLGGGWVTTAFAARSSAQSETQKPSSTAHKRGSSSATKKKRKSTRHHVSPIRVRRVKRAFVASTDLRPMARQLLQDRTPAAYAGVERYARAHPGDAGSLAWLAIGYAHLLDKQYAAAIPALKSARANAGELGDYVDYYLASAYAGAGDFPHAAATLKDFQSTYPDSLLDRDALVAYGNALVSTSQEHQAIALLEAHRMPLRADLELALARAYSAAGEPVRAAQTLERIYYGMPLAAEAGDAEMLLKPLYGVLGVPPVTFQERKTRAELLAQARRFNDAIVEYRALAGQASSEDLPGVQVALAAALYRAGRTWECQQMLQKLPPLIGEPDAQRQYLLLEMERPDANQVEATLSSLRANYPRSTWFQESLLSAANMYLLQPDYQQASALYYELAQRFPAGKYAAYAHWKAAWLKFRLGRGDEARTLFEKHVELYPTSNQAAPALYWRARMAEDARDYSRARAWYQKLQERFRYYYYADLARQRLSALPATTEPVADPLLDHIPALRPVIAGSSELPADDLRAQKSLLLENGALYDQALRELQAAAGDGNSPWALVQIAHLYEQQQRYDRALQTLKKAVPQYFSFELEQLPRPVWEALFPRPWWSEVKKYAMENQLDPYLVAALIRQESEFNPAAISRADAIGLMQLLPSTGKRMAHELKVHRYSVGMLVEPNINVQLGTRYFRELLQKFNGNVEAALAAYNAGSDRVEQWTSSGNFREPAEFVESIPFTETRDYVQAILRNTGLYHRLYGSP